MYKGCGLVFGLLALQLASATIVVGNWKPTLPKKYVYYEEFDTAYRFSTSPANWTTAQERCISEGANLAVIDIREKLDYIRSGMSWLRWVWVGVYRKSQRNGWRDVLGDSTSSSLPWALLNPKPDGDCVAISGFISGFGNWPCEQRHIYLCEIVKIRQFNIFESEQFETQIPRPQTYKAESSIESWAEF